MLELWQLRPPSSRCPYQFAEQFPHSFLSEVEGLAPGTSVSLKISTITGLPCVRPISDHRFNSCIALVTGRAQLPRQSLPRTTKRHPIAVEFVVLIVATLAAAEVSSLPEPLKKSDTP
jgi:hypothetical protein